MATALDQAPALPDLLKEELRDICIEGNVPDNPSAFYTLAHASKLYSLGETEAAHKILGTMGKSDSVPVTTAKKAPLDKISR